MANWTQPNDWHRKLDTDFATTTDRDGFTANFDVLGRIEYGASGAVYYPPTGSPVALPALGDTIILKTIDGTGTVTYSDYYYEGVRGTSHDNAYAEVSMSFKKRTYSIVFARPSVTVEVLWQSSQTPIEYHPTFASMLVTDTASVTLTEAGVTKTATLTMGEILSKWSSEGSMDPTNRKALYDAMNADTKKLAKKKIQGIHSYFTFSPLVRRTTRSNTAPSPVAAGMKEVPPIAIPGTWVFLKTAANPTYTGESGTWELVEEWAGAKELDPDLYS